MERVETAPYHHFASTHSNSRGRRMTGFGLLALTLSVLGVDYGLLQQVHRNDALAAAVKRNDFRTADRLLRQGADSNTYLVYESISGDSARLIEWIVGTRNLSWRSTPLLTIASSNGSPEVVETLLDLGADIEGTDQHGWTALMAATEAGETGVVRVLLRRKAAVNVKNFYGSTALNVAITNYRYGLVKLLKQAGAHE